MPCKKEKMIPLSLLHTEGRTHENLGDSVTLQKNLAPLSPTHTQVELARAMGRGAGGEGRREVEMVNGEV